MSSFQKKTVPERKAEVLRLLKKYPDKIPVIIVKDKQCKNLAEPSATKFLIPRELSVAQFIYTLRKRIFLNSEQALFLFFNNTIVNTSEDMFSVYEKFRDKDDEMLYAVYSTESTFG
jgi:GABA(A) receptor-associated protein